MVKNERVINIDIDFNVWYFCYFFWYFFLIIVNNGVSSIMFECELVGYF